MIKRQKMGFRKKWLTCLSVFSLNWIGVVTGIIISVFENTEFKLIVMCNFYSTYSGINILKSCKPKLFYSLGYRADFYTVCHVLI